MGYGQQADQLRGADIYSVSWGGPPSHVHLLHGLLPVPPWHPGQSVSTRPPWMLDVLTCRIGPGDGN